CSGRATWCLSRARGRWDSKPSRRNYEAECLFQESPPGFWPAITRRAAASSVVPIALLSGLPTSLHRLVPATQKRGNIAERGIDGTRPRRGARGAHHLDPRRSLLHRLPAETLSRADDPRGGAR